MDNYAAQVELGLHRLLKYTALKHLSKLALETQDMLMLEDFEAEGFAPIKEAVDHGLHRRLLGHGILGSTVMVDRRAPVSYAIRGPQHSDASEHGHCGTYAGMVLRAEAFSDTIAGIFPQITHVITSPEGFCVPGAADRPKQAFVPVTFSEINFLN